MWCVYIEIEWNTRKILNLNNFMVVSHQCFWVINFVEIDRERKIFHHFFIMYGKKILAIHARLTTLLHHLNIIMWILRRDLRGVETLESLISWKILKSVLNPCGRKTFSECLESSDEYRNICDFLMNFLQVW